MDDLPDDVIARVALWASPHALAAMAAASRVLAAPLLSDQLLWRALCRRHGLLSAAPGPSPAGSDWRAAFRHAYGTRRNWAAGRARWWAVDTSGHVCLAIAHDAAHVLSSASPEDAVLRWDAACGLSRHAAASVAMPAGARVAAAAFAGRDVLACGTRDGLVRVRDMREPPGACLVMCATGAEVCSVAAGGWRFVAGGIDGSVAEWDVRAGRRPLSVRVCGQGAVAALALCNATVAAGTLAGALYVDGVKMCEATDTDAVNAVSFEDGGTAVVVARDSGVLERVVVAGRQRNVILRTADAALTSVHVAPNGLFVAGGSDGVLRCGSVHATKKDCSHDWIASPDAAEVRPHGIKHAGQRGVVWQVHTDGTRVLSASLDGRLLVHDFAPQRP